MKINPIQQNYNNSFGAIKIKNIVKTVNYGTNVFAKEQKSLFWQKVKTAWNLANKLQ